MAGGAAGLNHSPNNPCVIGAHGGTRTPNICVLSAATLPIGLHGHFNFGWGSRVRTRHLLIQSQTFYQLNYPPKKTEVYQGDETRTGTLGHKLLVRNERLELPTVCV